MSPESRRPGLVRALTGAALIGLLATILTACSGAAFDPSTPCTADGRAAGAYPELEALVPRDFRGVAPSRVDSGRTCTPVGLGSLALHDVEELQFAGATWELGSGAGVTLAVFEAPGLQPGWMEEFYESGARAAKRTETVETGTIELPNGATAFRLDTLNGESYQTVIVWPDGTRVRAALVASAVRETQTKAAHELVVTDAIAAAFATGFATPPSRSRPG
ncbi:MAG TPA: hypothetical protein VFO73_09280 [Candidatus Limnocylindrales bacterium]|nr:hypothetical protein [Candidatus Limnocylindrales bacterium]